MATKYYRLVDSEGNPLASGYNSKLESTLARHYRSLVLNEMDEPDRQKMERANTYDILQMAMGAGFSIESSPKPFEEYD